MGKRKSRRRSSKKRFSNSKKNWERMLKDTKTIEALKKSWDAKNPQEYYRKTIQKLARKHGISGSTTGSKGPKGPKGTKN